MDRVVIGVWRAGSALAAAGLLTFVGCGSDSSDGKTPNSGGSAGMGGNDTGGASTGGNGSGSGGSAATGGTSAGGNGSSSGGNLGTGNAGTGGNYEDDPLLAFPGARGFGARVTGGRGGRVIKVTNLEASGPGSLQEALDQEGPRIIVFAVSGVIHADIITVSHGNVTIAGQSAPGAGITIHGRFFAEYDESVSNIIVRHLRIRAEYDGSSGDQFDAVQFSRNHHFILDHVSISGGADENADFYSAHDATIQWSTIESSGTQGHSEGAHNYGLINGPEGVRLSVLNNLFAHHRNRCPAIANGPAEVVNNVVYNVRHAFVNHNPSSGAFNLVGNTFVTGNEDELFPFFFDGTESPSELSYFIDDNWLDGDNSPCESGELTNPWTQCDFDLLAPESVRASTAHDFSGAGDTYYSTDVVAASTAYDAVLNGAGAYPRDVVAVRSVTETTNGDGEWGERFPADLMVGLTVGEAPTDADDDGMADDWETANGLDPSDGTDHATEMESGYTAIEEYLNELAASLSP